jgi:hypothetical protein
MNGTQSPTASQNQSLYISNNNNNNNNNNSTTSDDAKIKANFYQGAKAGTHAKRTFLFFFFVKKKKLNFKSCFNYSIRAAKLGTSTTRSQIGEHV